jgi:hypothetical protein
MLKLPCAFSSKLCSIVINRHFKAAVPLPYSARSLQRPITINMNRDTAPPSSRVNGIGAAQGESAKAMGPDSPLPSVAEFDRDAYTAEDELVQNIIESVKVAGGCIVRHLLRQELLDEIEREVRPSLDAATTSRGKWAPPEPVNHCRCSSPRY